MQLQHYLYISIVLFSLGVFAVLTRRNAISILMGVELILNSCNLNFVAFSHFITADITGHMVALFGIVLAAAEADQPGPLVSLLAGQKSGKLPVPIVIIPQGLSEDVIDDLASRSN